MKKIPKTQVAERLRSDNIWWEEPYRVPPQIDKYKARPYFKIFYPFIQKKDIQRAIVLMGPRRVGKTVLVHHAIKQLIKDGVSPKKICYISVDHPLYNGLDLEKFIEAFGEATGIDYKEEECYVFFDEIQYLKGWEMYLKRLVDRYVNIKCIVSGSAAAALRLKSLESGAGRFSNFLLPPLTFYEYIYLLDKTEIISEEKMEKGYLSKVSTNNIRLLNKFFVKYLNFGGYPEVALSKEIQKNPGQFVKSDIIDKVLLRDLPSLYGIHDIQELNYLFTTLAFNTANEVSLEDLSKGSGIVKNTIKKYIEYLEAAFLIKTVHRVDRSAKRFKRANYFKVYLTNPSMRSALFNVVKEDDPAMGQLVETSIFAQWFHSNQPLYYARWPKGEVDIVNLIPENQKIDWIIEVKWSDRIISRLQELKSVIQFCHEHNLKKAMVTSRTTSKQFVHKNVEVSFTPASLYCYILGQNVINERFIFEGLDPK